MAGSGPQAIKVAAKYTDGLITTSKPDQAGEVFDIFDSAAQEVQTRILIHSKK